MMSDQEIADALKLIEQIGQATPSAKPSAEPAATAHPALKLIEDASNMAGTGITTPMPTELAPSRLPAQVPAGTSPLLDAISPDLRQNSFILGIRNALQPGVHDYQMGGLGRFLPIAHDEVTGVNRLAWPQAVQQLGNGALDLIEGPRTGTVSPDAQMALATAAMSGRLTPSLGEIVGNGHPKLFRSAPPEAPPGPAPIAPAPPAVPVTEPLVVPASELPESFTSRPFAPGFNLNAGSRMAPNGQYLMNFEPSSSANVKPGLMEPAANPFTIPTPPPPKPAVPAAEPIPVDKTSTPNANPGSPETNKYVGLLHELLTHKLSTSVTASASAIGGSALGSLFGPAGTITGTMVGGALGVMAEPYIRAASRQFGKATGAAVASAFQTMVANQNANMLTGQGNSLSPNALGRSQPAQYPPGYI